jgi:uncharacterized protein YjeT (DUF2065 family)
MSLIDALIPLIIGLLLVARPQAFTKRTGSAEEAAARDAKLRKIGYGLVGVGVLFAVIAALGR